MSFVLPFDIAVQIIDIAGETENKDLLKRLALVSHSFNQICSKYLFATVELHDANRGPIPGKPSSKKGFVKLVKSRPEVIKYIRKLSFTLTRTKNNNDNVDHLISPILSNFLPTTSCLNSLEISGLSNWNSRRDWNKLDSSLTSAFLHLMRFPTINHIDLLDVLNFPVLFLTSTVNLHRLNMFYLTNVIKPHEKDGSFEIVQSETAAPPKIRELNIIGSSPSTMRLLRGKRQDGQPGFNFVDLRRLSMSFTLAEDEENIRYFLENAQLLEKLRLDIYGDVSLWGHDDIFSACARTLKVIDLSIPLYSNATSRPQLAGLCEGLEAMAGHDMLETLSFELFLNRLKTEDSIGPLVQEVERLLVKPGWSALKQVSIKISIAFGPKEERESLVEALQSLPDKYLSRLSNLESIALNYSVVIVY